MEPQCHGVNAEVDYMYEVMCWSDGCTHVGCTLT